jgi:hypothetical protein
LTALVQQIANHVRISSPTNDLSRPVALQEAS